MPKQLNVSLAFTADTSAAKKQIQDLQKSLSDLIKSTSASQQLGLTKELVEAKSAAAELQVMLKGATTSTGSLDLSKFSNSLQKSGQTLDQYRLKLEKLGPEGSNAFLKLANSIVSAEAPLKRTNALLDNFKTTLINTARWQISSSILHGFMGTLQSAYRYAQDLNQSLNNIRIVTGYSADEMAVFAERANKAAQSLSTSTTQYTDAALIYYQQGIRDQEEIAGRTETTIKLANVSRQSAQEVSDEMTAIWNNFYDGSQSLEYYADVITALGAATASSSEEISTGLEKFAAVSKTVGLSYEYATSALATITATTRQSADTVGTGLRTLFSRLEGLKLGETLEDGVDLNKYSQALESVGVQVLDVSGELRNMDDILDDLGERWGELSQAQKMALAQTVGGVRQYTNLIALMDNWDFMQQNLGVAQGAEGTLQEQADIYAESWEAAQKRVKAAAQSIYQDLLNDDFFITLLNTFAKIISGIDSIIDSMGGLKGVLWGVGALLSQVYGESMARSIDNMIFNIQRGTEAFKAQQEQFRQEAINSAMKVNADGSNLGEAKVDSLQHQIQMQQQLRSVAESLSAEELERLQYEIDIVKQLDDQVEAAARLKDEATKNMSDSRSDLLRDSARRNKTSDELTGVTDREALSGLQELETRAVKAQKSFDTLNAKFKDGTITAKQYEQGIAGLQNKLINNGFDKAGNTIGQLDKALKAAGQGTQEFEKYLGVLQSEGGLATETLIDLDKVSDELSESFGWDAKELDTFRTSVREFVSSGMTMDQAMKAAAQGVEDFRQKTLEAKAATETLGTTGQTIIKSFGAISQVMMGLNSLSSIFDTLSNPDLSGWEKFSKTLMSLSMGLPMVMTGFGKLKELYNALKVATMAETAAQEKNLAVKYIAIAAAKIREGVEIRELALKAKNIALDKISTAIKMAQAIATTAYDIITKVLAGDLTIATAAQTALNMAMTASPVGVVVAAIVALIAAIALLVAGIKGLINWWNKDANAAKDAADKAKQAQDAFNNAQQAYNDLISSIEDYKGARDAIDNLTAGTDEWRAKIQEANQQVLELLKTYPELAQYIEKVNNGGVTELRISDEGLDQFAEMQYERVNQAASASYQASINANNAQNQADVTETARDIGVSNGAVEAVLQAIGNHGNGIFGDYGEFVSAMHEVGVYSDGMINALYNNQDAVLKLSSSVDANTTANDILGEQIVDANFGDQLEKLDDTTQSAVSNMINANLQGKTEALYQSKYADGMGMTDNEIQTAYAEAMGWGSHKNKAGNKAVYYDQSGAEVGTIDDEVARRYLAQQEAIQSLGDDVVEAYSQMAQELIDTGNKIGKGVGEALLSFMGGEGGDLSTLSKSELGDLKDQVGGLNLWGTKFKIGDQEIGLEEAQAAGYDSVRAYYDAIQDSINASESEFENLGEDIFGPLKNAYNEIIAQTKGDFSSAGAKAVGSLLEDAYQSAGFSGSATISEELKKAGAEADEIALALSDIDWQSANLKDVEQALKDAGINVDALGINVEAIFQTMREGSEKTLSEIQAQWAETQSIIKGLKSGDTISDEDYQKLVNQYGTEAMDVYFSTMADGTHRLIQDADDFYAHITNASRQDMLANIDKSATTAATINSGETSIDRMNGGNIQTQETAAAADTYLSTLELTEEELNKLILAQEDFAKTGEYSASSMAILNELMREHNITQEEFDNLKEQAIQDLQANAEAYLSTATSISELDALDAQLKQQGIDTTIGYSEALIGLAGQYENTAEEIEKYQQALQSGNEEQIEATKDALKAATKLGEAAEKYDLNAKSLEAQAREIADAEGVTAEQAAVMAVANQRLNKGVSKLNKSWKDWKKTLTSTDRTSQDYADTLVDLSDSVGDIVGWYKELNLSSKFVEKNMDLIEQAASGDTTAILELGAAVAQAEIAESELNTTMAEGAMADGSENAFQKWSNDAISAQQNFENLKGKLGETFGLIQSKMAELQGGASLQDILGGPGGVEAFVQQLNAYASATGMTAEQMQSMLSSIGVTANVQSDYQEQTVKVPTYDEYSQVEQVGVETLSGTASDGSVLQSDIPVWHKRTYTVMGPPIETTGYVEVASIAMEDNNGNPTPPVFSGRKAPSPSSTGNNGNGSGSPRRSRRGNRNRRPEKKDKKEKFEIDEKEYKKEDKEIERYHEIKNTLETIGFNLDKIAQKKDKAFGKAKLKAIAEETKELEKQAGAQKKYLKEIEGYLSSDKSAIAAYGATFDADGNINNYDEMMQKQINQYNADYDKFIKAQNAAVTKFNNSDRDEKAEKEYDKAIKAAEKQWEADQQKYAGFEDALKQYEETYDLFKEEGINLQDILDKILENKLDAIDYSVQIKVDVDERDIALLQDLLEGLGEAADVAADAIVNYGKQMSSVMNKAEQYKQGITDILTTFGASDALIQRAMNNELTQEDLNFLEAAGITEQAMDLLHDYTDGLIQCNGEARSLADDAIGRLADSFDEYTDNLDRNSEAIEHLQKVNETYKNIIDIVGKKVLDSSGELTKTLSKTNWELQRNNTHALKSEMEFIAKSRESLEKEIESLRGKNDAESKRTLHQLEEQLKDVTDKYTETYESWLDSWEAELQAAADMYTETLENIVDNFEDSIAGAMGSMSELQEAFDRKKAIDDVYLDDYEKIYQLSKLNRDINNSIDDTDNIKSKQALKKLLGEIEQLQEDGVELSEYDVENARRRYELALALQQLEEAQDAKSQVRMRRDSEGNYGYVYTADANAVADAEQNYEDKLYAMQKANADYIDSLQSNIIQAQQECSEALANLNAADYASYEEYQAAAQEIRDHYQELIADYFQQLGNAVDNNRELYTTDWAEYSAATGYKISADEAYVDSFGETVYSVLTGFETMEDAQLAFASATDDALNDMAMAWYEWYEQTQISLSDGGTSIEDYANTVSEKTEEIEGYGKRLEDSAASMADSYKTAYDNILNKLKEFLLNYTDNVKSIISLDNQLATSINKVTAALTGFNETGTGSSSSDDDDKDDEPTTGSGGGGAGGHGASGNKPKKNKDKPKKNKDKPKKNKGNRGGWKGKTYTVRSGDTMIGIGHKLGVDPKKLWNHNRGHMRGSNWNWIWPGEKIYYDTGGYTGAWGPEGKLAFLHQKELVLNASDTQNFLAGIDILRQISETIDLNALMASNSLVNGLNSEVNTSSNDGTLQQMVNITAEFKDATTASEITAAFDNLINRASQFANRKN